MTFDLHIHGETPEELLDALNHLGGTTNIINASPAPQAQSEPVTQPDKPKAPAAPAKQKKAAQKSAAAPASDPAALDKIRDLARSLIVHGKRAEVQQIIKATGAASISKLPSDSYADVWEQLVNLSKEVDNNATG